MENGKNIIKKGEVIFAQGDTVSHIGIVLAGKVLMQNEWMRLVRNQGSFIALNDWNRDTYGASYTTLEDSVIYMLSVSGEETLHNVITKSDDYRAIMVSSQFHYITDMAHLREDLHMRASRLYEFAKEAIRGIKICAWQSEYPLLSLKNWMSWKSVNTRWKLMKTDWAIMQRQQGFL